ncbi:mannose-6-phosphate isomerase, class I [Paenibacillus sp. 32352]|uniref:mannose-6-phosphate isomerase, class I n=1 Tax=Paenibacillus sp. 32352 TaxID=1969111 RepID=UPI00277B52E9|nr:mannose-6-phosphate isomerase, class I [Paenibacillus sp. 32352]
MNYAIGIDIGGTKTAIGLVDSTGHIESKRILSTEGSPGTMVERIAAAIRELCGEASVEPAHLQGIGIGAPGPLHPTSGLIVCPPNLPDWKGFQLVGELHKYFDNPVLMENDATAATLAEKWIGAGKDSDHFIYLTISTGIGAGIYLHGKLITGSTGNAGDAGHMVVDPAAGRCSCGQDGCWEFAASGTAIARQASSMLGRQVTAQEAFSLAEQGDDSMRQLFQTIFRQIGVGCVSLINVLDPEKIIIGGGVSKIGGLLFQEIQNYVALHALNPSGRNTPIIPAALGQDAGLIGAAALIHIGKEPGVSPKEERLQERPSIEKRNHPLFLEPVFQERIWGGTKLRDKFGYDIPYANTGECWAVSAHPNGQSIVRNGEYQGLPLGELWGRHRFLFCDPALVSPDAPFPLLIKILDASDDLSVQVHPDDTYAAVHENGELGKTECWYILDAEPDAEIIYGHRAQSKEQFVEEVRSGNWSSLLTRVKVKAGDFYYIPSGTLHALGRGIVVLETQQSSDTTYRVYDYNRIGQDGKPRELHLDKAMDVTSVPHQPVEPLIRSTVQGDCVRTTMISNTFFTVQKWDITGTALFEEPSDHFLIVSVIDGTGALECEDTLYSLRKGDHFLLPRNVGPYRISGRLELIVSGPGEK